MRRFSVVVPACLTVVATTLVSCSNKNATPAAAPSVPGAAVASSSATGPTLIIASFQYNALTVSPGQLITVKNNDAVDHTATSKTPGLFDVSVSKGEPKTFRAPTTPGTYQIICRIHSSMAGTLVVKA